MRLQDFGQQQKQPNSSGDASMPTAPPQQYQQQQGFRVNELELYNYEPCFEYDNKYEECYAEDTYTETTSLALLETAYDFNQNTNVDAFCRIPVHILDTENTEDNNNNKHSGEHR